MPLTIKPASGSGSATLISVAGTTTNDTLTLPAKTGNIITSADSGTVTQAMLASGVVGAGPTVIANRNTDQTISNSTWTKVQVNNVNYDTSGNFNSSSTYRYTPNVAGYYMVVGQVYASTTTSISYATVGIYKNGGGVLYGTQTSVAGANVVSGFVYLNGSTDYIELYAYITGTGTLAVSSGGTGGTQSYINAALIRSA